MKIVSRTSAGLAGMAFFALLASGCFSSKDEAPQSEAAPAKEPPSVAKLAGPPAEPAPKPSPLSASPLGDRYAEHAGPEKVAAIESAPSPPRFGRTDEPASPSLSKADTDHAPQLLPVDSRQELRASPKPAPDAQEASDRPNPLRGGSQPSPGGVPRRPASEPGARAGDPEIAVPVTPPSENASKPEADQQPKSPAGAAAQDVPKKPGPIAEIRVNPGPGSETPPSGPAQGKHNRPPFDPIKENGRIFVGWDKPKLALVITGRQDGYLEPCGCAGLDRMKGGMARRDTLLKSLRAKGWPILVLDVGGIANKRFSHQAVLKFQTAVEAMWKMGYDAIMLGPSDLKLPGGELLSAVLGDGSKKSLFVAANVALIDADATPRFRILEAGGKKLGVTGVLGKKYQKEINNSDVKMADPESALTKVLPELKNMDGLVLLSYADLKETMELAAKFPQFNVVVTAGGPPEPPSSLDNLRPIPGSRARLIEVGEKGMNVIVLGLFDDPQQPVRYQRVPLDSRFSASPDMKARMAVYQDQLKTLGFSGLGVRPEPHPLKETNGRFVGSEKCESCHSESYKIWKKTPHAAAYQSLVHADPARNFDPECISCHVVGWSPREFHPYESGYLSQEKTPKMLNVGCEDCHGPGEKHVAAEMGNDKGLQKKLQQAMHISKADASDPSSPKQNCYSCHDGDNSPDFDFKKYWPQVEHHEKE